MDDREWFDLTPRVRDLFSNGLFEQWSMLGAWSSESCTALTLRRNEDEPQVYRWPLDQPAADFIDDVHHGRVAAESLSVGPWERSPLHEPARHGFLDSSLTDRIYSRGPWAEYRGPTWAETMAVWVALLGGDFAGPINPTLGVWMTAPDEIMFCQALWATHVGGFDELSDPWGTGHLWQVVVERLGSYGNMANPWSPDWAGQAISYVNEIGPLGPIEANPERVSEAGFYRTYGDGYPEPVERLCAHLTHLTRQG